MKTEDSQFAFTKAAANLAKQAEILNRKRGQRHAFATTTDSPSPAVRAEIQATLAAIDISITRELEIYQAAEISLLQIRETIDPNAKLAHEMELQAQALQQAYHRTRGK